VNARRSREKRRDVNRAGFAAGKTAPKQLCGNSMRMRVLRAETCVARALTKPARIADSIRGSVRTAAHFNNGMHAPN
jgi:hypothetical protein